MIQTFSELNDDFLFPDCSGIQIDTLQEQQLKYQPVNNDSSEAYYHQLLSKDIYIGYHRMKLGSDRSFSLARSTDVLQMHFVIKGKYEFRRNNRTIISVNESEHNILFLTEESVIVNVSKDEELEFVEIQLDLAFVERYISGKHIIHDKIRSGKPVSLNEVNMEISPQIQSALHELVNCQFEGNLKSLYVRAKVIELFSLQLAQYEETARAKLSGLRVTEIDKMNTVRALITSSPEKTYSLAYLARVAGTNEQYLKSHFKMIYGKTVFNYLTSYRMERAKDLLLQGNKKIAEVAQEVGYRHSTHFTQAFKKHFGYLPLKIKGTMKAIIYGSTQLAFEAEILSLFTF